MSAEHEPTHRLEAKRKGAVSALNLYLNAYLKRSPETPPQPPSLVQINTLLTNLTEAIQSSQPGTSTLDFFNSVASDMPNFIARSVQSVLVDGISDRDRDTQRMGRRALLFLNMKTILLAVKPYFSDERDTDEEILHAVFTGMDKKVDKLKIFQNIVGGIHQFSTSAATEYIAAYYGLPIEWVKRDGLYREVIKTVDAALQRNIPGLTKEQIAEIVHGLHERTSYDPEELEGFVKKRSNAFFGEDDSVSTELSTIHFRTYPLSQIDAVLTSMVEAGEISQLLVDFVRVKYGLDDGVEKGDKETAETFGVTELRVKANVSQALRKLRHWSVSRRLQESFRVVNDYRDMN